MFIIWAFSHNAVFFICLEASRHFKGLVFCLFPEWESNAAEKCQLEKNFTSF
jgi:hypothetical protein